MCWNLSENTQEMIKRRCQSIEKKDEIFLSLAEKEDEEETSVNELEL